MPTSPPADSAAVAATRPLAGRDFLKELDFTAAELSSLISLAAQLKADKREHTEVQRLRRRNVALIFEKTSTRTRCAFEVATYDQGGHVTYIDPTSSQFGHKESVADTAKVLSRFYDAIEFRGHGQQTVETLALNADVPVYNGLTDEWHPTQMLADFLTMSEAREVAAGEASGSAADGTAWADLSYCYLGDARSNMGNSLLVMGAILGADVRIAAPRELWPNAEVQAAAHRRAEESGARITLTEDPATALAGAQFVHTDVWVSLGEPASVWAERVELLRGYRVDAAMLALTDRPDTAFLHCLPSFHDTNTAVAKQVAELTGLDDGIEVSSEVFASSANLAFDQAENRLHTIKAVLVATIGDRSG
ncbi:MAG: ornithine carbamoyltransferase [Actinomycetota bacterium]|nr:ornithine carbamoyltransferase [Actinomycetota bacterium]